MESSFSSSFSYRNWFQKQERYNESTPTEASLCVYPHLLGRLNAQVPEAIEDNSFDRFVGRRLMQPDVFLL
jgi:hypothetical protein